MYYVKKNSQSFEKKVLFSLISSFFLRFNLCRFLTCFALAVDEHSFSFGIIPKNWGVSKFQKNKTWSGAYNHNVPKCSKDFGLYHRLSECTTLYQDLKIIPKRVKLYRIDKAIFKYDTFWASAEKPTLLRL